MDEVRPMGDTVIDWGVRGRRPCSRYLERLKRVIPGLATVAKDLCSNVRQICRLHLQSVKTNTL